MLASRFALCRRAVHLLVFALVVLGASGCGIFSPTTEKETEQTPDPFQLATTQDKLIENLERAYRDRNFPEYSKLLHGDFEFFFAQADIQDVQKEFWNRQEEINATERMFSGQPSRDGESIQSITITLTPLGTGGWSPDVPDQFAGSTSRNYCVNMDVQAGDTTFQVRGLQRFYATEVDGVFQLSGWEDFGSNEDCGF